MLARVAGSGLSWSKEVVSLVYRYRCTGVQVYSVQVMTPVFRPGPEQDLAQQYGEPSCLLWWETSDFIQLGFVATSAGHVLAVNLVTATLVSRHVSHVTRDPRAVCRWRAARCRGRWRGWR